MAWPGASKSVIVSAVAVVVIAIASFLGGVEVGRSSISQQQATQVLTITLPIKTTLTQIVTYQQPMFQTIIQVPDKTVIGVAIALSGSYSDAGKRVLAGIQAAIKWVNEVYGGVKLYGKRIPLDLKYYDDESKKDLAIALTERLITVDKVHFIFAPYSSPLAFAAAPVAEKYRMVLINAGGATDAINEQGFKYVVTVWTPSSQYHWTTLNAIKQVEPKARIALLFADDEFNRYSYRGVVSKARELGLQIVYEKLFPLDTKDFTPYLTELAASKADVLIAGAYLAGGQVLIKQIADLGINFKLISITHAPCLPDFYRALGTLAEGIVCPSQWEPGASYTPELARSKGVEWFGPTTEEFLKLFRDVTEGKLEPGYWGGAGAVGGSRSCKGH